MTTQLALRSLRTDADEKFLESVYRDILEPSFTADELDPLEVIRDGLADDGDYQIWGLCAVADETPVGCILGYRYPESGVLLIGYVAVRPGERGRGAGGLLLGAARQQWYGNASISLVLAEIDDPRCHPVVNGIDPERRVAFYARHDTRLVVGPYFQPRLEGERKQRAYALFLTVLDGASDTVPAARVAGFLTEYFRQAGEGSDWPRADDAEGNWLLNWYRDRATVGLRPIGEYRDADIPQVPGRA